MTTLRSILSAAALSVLALALARCAMRPDLVEWKPCKDGTFCPIDDACYDEGTTSTCVQCADLREPAYQAMHWQACAGGLLCPQEIGCFSDGTGCVRDTCRDSPVGCGNGVKARSEECDDGNLTDGDGCDSNCRVTSCGNGRKTDGEECDDGNLSDGDRCDSACKREPEPPM